MAQSKHSNSLPWRQFIKCYTEVKEAQNSISKVSENRAVLFTGTSPTLIVTIQWSKRLVVIYLFISCVNIMQDQNKLNYIKLYLKHVEPHYSLILFNCVHSS